MKILNLIIGLLSTLAVCAASEPEFWVGECHNKTSGGKGFLRMTLVPDQSAKPGAPSFDGLLSVSGWLGGGGDFAVKPSEGVYKFQTRDSAVIDWNGKATGIDLAGTYVVPGQADIPPQTGEFTMRRVPAKQGTEGYFRQVLATLVELSFNSPPSSENGALIDRKQMLFDQLHPAGTAASVRVKDVEIGWQEGSKKESLDDIRRFTVDLTLYWVGVIQAEGWTKMRLSYNAEIGEMSGYQVVGTTVSLVRRRATSPRTSD